MPQEASKVLLACLHPLQEGLLLPSHLSQAMHAYSSPI